MYTFSNYIKEVSHQKITIIPISFSPPQSNVLPVRRYCQFESSVYIAIPEIHCNSAIRTKWMSLYICPRELYLLVFFHPKLGVCFYLFLMPLLQWKRDLTQGVCGKKVKFDFLLRGNWVSWRRETNCRSSIGWCIYPNPSPLSKHHDSWSRIYQLSTLNIPFDRFERLKWRWVSNFQV